MCGRFYLTVSPEQLIDTFQLPGLPHYETSYNIPPGQKILTIVKLDNDGYKAVNLYWGLIPHWSQDNKVSHHLINARAETLAEKPAFRTAYKQRRCLILANGFYEWKQSKHGKQAYCISRKDNQLITFAGLWEYWEHGTETIYSCSIITRSANELIKPIHKRMPAVIDSQHYKDWLNKQALLQTTEQLLISDAYQNIELKPVSNWVNNPQHNDQKCLR
ncbi:MAG TPA: SOS response-associated peptidase [Methyloprofundus sp.]|uniref:SOS response-associated peptidase n=1 Tax=Methyloprofundus sp. TaxID=2020875 RepID=UPI0017A85E70|nr:SOS response-associated peptidase [Methyloprofundus sp.]HIG65071.1 SOS response-associated peptidase [Methyloprofundus sp.]HIL78459.1 SOS response-associated peptidase [Methylococcales bacterium]